jgi:hypothetical protein
MIHVFESRAFFGIESSLADHLQPQPSIITCIQNMFQHDRLVSPQVNDNQY